jgi:hypothetical protein
VAGRRPNSRRVPRSPLVAAVARLASLSADEAGPSTRAESDSQKGPRETEAGQGWRARFGWRRGASSHWLPGWGMEAGRDAEPGSLEAVVDDQDAVLGPVSMK